jgi:hypothetical protein
VHNYAKCLSWLTCVPRQVELPSCLDNPQAPSNTPMARLKRTAERAGALLAFQVKINLHIDAAHLLHIPLCCC